uniref:F-box protein 15 n=1 Tax=Molossus molossus TaxID=27622 RepID=A0A7J8HH86_MOLMO|nr:F-box protein 15 [Molossus molossus]
MPGCIVHLGLVWRDTSFYGSVQAHHQKWSCAVMDLTLLDEYRKPFWCFSSPVCMRPSPSPSGGPHFAGETYCIEHKDAAGTVHVQLVWLEETEEYFIVSLVLYLSTARINRWFGTEY